MKTISKVFIDDKRHIVIRLEDGSEIETPLLNHCQTFFSTFSTPDLNNFDIRCVRCGNVWEVLFYAYSKTGESILLDVIEIDQEFIRNSLPY